MSGDEFWLKLMTHLDEKFKDMEAKLLDVLKSSVPNGDFEGHRRYHEGDIESSAAIKRYLQGLFLDGLKYALGGFCLFIAYAAAEAIKEWVKR